MSTVYYVTDVERTNKYFNYTVKVFDDATRICMAVWGAKSLADVITEISRDVIAYDYTIAGVIFEDKDGNIYS